MPGLGLIRNFWFASGIESVEATCCERSDMLAEAAKVDVMRAPLCSTVRVMSSASCSCGEADAGSIEVSMGLWGRRFVKGLLLNR